MHQNDFVGSLICSDSMEVMRKMPDKSIDLVLTDPPYGIGETNEKNSSRRKLSNPKDYGHYDWDNKKIDVEYFIEMRRISKNQIIFGGNYYSNYLPASSCWIVWDKDNSGDFADCELAWTSFSSAVRIFKWRWNGMLQQDMSNKEVRTHPTQKPRALMTWILNKYSKESDVILDPFMGSGTVIEACKLLNRNYCGIDINPSYVEMARERMKQGVLVASHF